MRFFSRQVELLTVLESVPEPLEKRHQILLRQIVLPVHLLEQISLDSRVFKPFLELLCVFLELFGVVGVVLSQEGHFEGEESLWGVLVLGELFAHLGALPHPLPHVEHILLHFAPALALISIVGVAVPQTEEDSLGRLLLELVNAHAHHDRQRLVLRTCMLPQLLLEYVDQQAMRSDEGETRHHLLVVLGGEGSTSSPSRWVS